MEGTLGGKETLRGQKGLESSCLLLDELREGRGSWRSGALAGVPVRFQGDSRILRGRVLDTGRRRGSRCAKPRSGGNGGMC